VNLQAAEVESGGKVLDQSQAVMVTASKGGKVWSLLANPQRKSVEAKLPDGSRLESDAVLLVR
ncbi:MAG TPA: hypothetical protein VHC44_09785, partial [Verrucomicrobiae bacterium]|nr:hypothetical protein [Verrucomicrobiae bacterium]